MRWVLVACLLIGGPASQPLDTWFIFVDAWHIQFMNTGHLRTALRGFYADVLADSAFFTLHTSGPTGAGVAFTNDRAKLSSVIKTVTGHGLRADHAPQEEMTRRLQQSMSEFGQALDAVVWREGRPAFVLVLSNAYFTSAEYRAAFAAACRGRLSPDTQIYVVDPRRSETTILEHMERGRVTLTP